MGPLLFLIFINDIVHVVRHCKIRLFADDTCLFVEIDDPHEAATLINEDLGKIQSWADQWLVAFSPHKTKEMIVTLKTTQVSHPPIKFLDATVLTVDKHKTYVGMTI